jgi:hypothetical protein
MSLGFQVLYAGRSCLLSCDIRATLPRLQCTVMSRCRACAVDEYDVTDGVEYFDPTLFDGHYLRSRSTLDIGVLGYIGIF